MRATPPPRFRLTSSPPSPEQQQLATDFGDDAETLARVKAYLALGDAALAANAVPEIDIPSKEDKKPVIERRAA